MAKITLEGENIISNGDFINGTVHWDVYNVDIVDGHAVFDADGEYIVQHETDMLYPQVPGVRYRVSFEVSQVVNRFVIRNESNSTTYYDGSATGGLNEFDITIPEGDTTFGFMFRLEELTLTPTYLDNIVIRRLDFFGKLVESYTICGQKFNTLDITGRGHSGCDYNIANDDEAYYKNITISKIRAMVAESVNALGQLSTSSNVNQWSAFGPYDMSVDGNHDVSLAVNVPHAAGEFAGYNHNAITPGLTVIDEYGNPINDGDIVETVPFEDRSRRFDITINLGELNYESFINSDDYLILNIKEDVVGSPGDINEYNVFIPQSEIIKDGSNNITILNPYQYQRDFPSDTGFGNRYDSVFKVSIGIEDSVNPGEAIISLNVPNTDFTITNEFTYAEANIISNGDFINGTVHWTTYEVDILGGEAIFNQDSSYIVQSGSDMLDQPLPGHDYRFEFDTDKNITQFTVYNESFEQWYQGSAAAGHVEVSFQVPSDETVFGMGFRINEHYDTPPTTIDNISMKRIN